MQNVFFLTFNSYYGFDKDVIREILGKRMSAKLRKDMDDVSEKTGIPLKRCRRQVIPCCYLPSNCHVFLVKIDYFVMAVCLVENQFSF